MGRVLDLVILLCCIALVRGQQRRSCNLSSCNGKPHTLCVYPLIGPATSCGQLGARGLNQNEKTAILNRHNQWRANVARGGERRGNKGPQPAARNLGPLRWNNEIAEIAQRWADQCNYRHDECRNAADNTHVGQNIAYVGWSDGWHEESLLEMVDNWYNEVKDFDKNMVKSLHLPPVPPGPKLGHYTQMVWAKTTSVGCGASRYKKKGEFYKTYLVCNYAPGGNYDGQAVYEPQSVKYSGKISVLMNSNKLTSTTPSIHIIRRQIQGVKINSAYDTRIALCQQIFIFSSVKPRGRFFKSTLRMIFSQVLLLCSLVLISEQQQRYCDLPSCGRNPHTLCLYPSPSPPASCGQLGRRGLTQGERNALLDRHNGYRARVASGQETRGAPGPQPAARNLGPLRWNNEIAEIAQRWADQCNYGHDRCRNTADDTYVGQNVAYIGWSDRWRNESLLEMVDMWYNEVADFNPSLLRAFFLPLNPLAPLIGHYTQMVWAGTHFLGCGASRYRKDGGYYVTFLVCNYVPGGNYLGQPIYEIL
ncbi:uncharacterized protein LOC135168315 [Diachasmimorpha longicaudata]|uniref:uncharacterized protein LOC135168315 n=1 Tax=Diachasmimorpha longicaudata TaxID=58733 RepID=UPI0030B8B95A